MSWSWFSVGLFFVCGSQVCKGYEFLLRFLISSSFLEVVVVFGQVVLLRVFGRGSDEVVD